MAARVSLRTRDPLRTGDTTALRIPLLTHKRPVDSDDALFRKSLQRFWKNQISRFLTFLQTDDAEIGSGFALQDRHQAVVFHLRLDVAISGGPLPKRVNLRFPALFNDLRETGCFHADEFHASASVPLMTLRDAQAGRLRYSKKSPPENYGKEDHTTVAAFLPWRGL